MGDYDNDPDFEYYRKLADLESINDNLTKESCNLSNAKEMIFNFLGFNYIWKKDLWKGYRHALRQKEQFCLCAMFVRVIHPISGAL